jgi:phosphatidate cytidylyltransferase
VQFLLKNSLFLRAVSAFVLMPLVLCALIFGGWLFVVVVVMAGLCALREWGRMTKLPPNTTAYAIGGIAYIVLCFASFIYLRFEYANGAGLALCLILSVWASDTGAYFVGKLIGGPKMAPSISPNKTWAGLFGGMVGSIGAIYIYAHHLGCDFSGWTKFNLLAFGGVDMWILIVIGMCITLAGQAGDLLVSREKRKVGVKDTGTLIPGHGGILDRIDSLMLAVPVFLLCLKVFGL